MWIAEKTKTFEKSYKRLSHDLQKVTNEAIINLVTSENPATLGTPKSGKYKGYIGYDLNRSYRLIYKVVNPQHIVLLVIVGDHKTVYGKD